MYGKVLLIVPPVRVSAPPTRFPLGLAYLAASLESSGFEISVLDLNIIRPDIHEEKKLVLEALQKMDVVGMGGMITMFKTISRITDYVKQYRPDLPVIVGGPIATNLQELLLKKSQIDVLVIGEGERVGSQLVSALIRQNKLHKIPGLAFLENGQLIITPSANRIDDLDSLPMPAYHLFPFKEYLRYRGNVHSTDIIASRGCPYKCNFCFRNFGNRVIFRSIHSIMKEIRFLKYFYGIKHIHLEDELFVQRKDFIKEFCQQMDKLEDLTWSACARVNTLSSSLLKQMKSAGCQWLMIGIESFCDELLKEMQKNITAEQIHTVCTWANEAGIIIRPGLIIGMPDETRESVQMTVKGCIHNKIMVDEWSYAFATPYPGTQLYKESKNSGLIQDEWEYMQKLCDVGDTRSLTINLTTFSDSELIGMRDNAIKSVARALQPNTHRKRKQTPLLSVIRNRLSSFMSVFRNGPKPAKSLFAGVYPEHFTENLNTAKAKQLFKSSVRMVEVEVFSFCNRRCWFCPNSHVDRHSKNLFMDEKLYQKILQNLSEINYDRKVSFSRYNEPLADPVIFKRIRQAKDAIPNADLHLNTNGDYLENDTLIRLYDAGLSSLHIQAYLPENVPYTDETATDYLLGQIEKYKLSASFIQSIPMESLEYSLIFKDMRIRIYIRNFNQNGVHRGGTIPRLNRACIRTSPCLIPFQDVYIDFNGKLVPCCNIRSDIPEHANMVLGDLNTKDTSLFNIFTSPKTVSWREKLIAYTEKDYPCDRCAFQEIEPSPKNICYADILKKKK